MNTLDAAKSYLERGWSLIPINPETKRPTIRRWKEFQTRHPSLDELGEWFGEGSRHGVAVVTGAISGIVVLDGDRHGGDGIRQLETKYDAFSRPTRMHLTRNRGVHLIYRHPGISMPNSHGQSGWLGEPAIDVKGDGGYFVVPPTPGYRMARDIEPVNCPGWLRPKMKPVPSGVGAQALVHGGNGAGTTDGRAALDREVAIVLTARQGGRNDQLNRSAFVLGQWVAVGELDEESVRVALSDAARAIGLHEDPGCGPRGVEATIASGLRAGRARPGGPRVVGSLPTETRSVAPSGEGIAPLGQILDRVEGFLRRFVWFASEHQAVAAALWVAHVYAIQVANTTPYLRVRSATAESGKSRLLEALYLLLGEERAELVANTSPAVLYRVLDERPLALLFDETDNTLAGRKDDRARDLLGLINNGYRRGMRALRMEGQRFEKVRRFKVFGPKALAGLADLPDTVESRCIPIVLQRKEPGRHVDEFIFDEVEPQVVPLREALSAWADSLDGGGERPSFPQGLRDRQKEVWRPLLVISDLAEGEWPERARLAAVKLHSSEQEASVSELVLLLQHIRDAFVEAGSDHLPTADLLKALVTNEEGPWARWWSRDVQAQANPNGPGSELARKLKPFGVRPIKLRIGQQTLRGYRYEDFVPVWDRYLPNTTQIGGTPGTDGTLPVPPVSSVPCVPAVPTGAEPLPPVDEGPGIDGETFIRERLAQYPGRNAFTLAFELNQRGIAAPEGGEWTVDMVERQLSQIAETVPAFHGSDGFASFHHSRAF